MFLRQLLRKRPVFKSPSTYASPFYRSVSDHSARTRVEKILNRLPRFTHRYTNGLRNAPVSHVVSFLVLHELTAIVPLVGLSYYFHVTHWLPVEWSEGSYIANYIDKFDRYFRKKRLFGLEPERDDVVNAGGPRDNAPPGKDVLQGHGAPLIDESDADQTKDDYVNKAAQGGGAAWDFTTGGRRVVVEVATAYAITKAMMPLRLVMSLWLTPWFARTIMLKMTNGFTRDIKMIWGRWISSKVKKGS